MITEDKLKVYNYFEGDIDEWARGGSRKQKRILDDADWALIEGLVQDLFLVKRNMASIEFENNLKVRLAENCDKEKTIKILEKIVDKR